MLKNISIETYYILITENKIYFIEGLTGPQFRDLGLFWKTICFLLNSLLIFSKGYPKHGLVFKKYNVQKYKKALIQIKEKRDENITCIHELFIFN